MDTGADPAEHAAPTIYDCQPDPDVRVDVRRLPALVRQALRIVWQAGRREFALASALQVLGALGVGAQLLLGRWALDALLAAQRAGEGLAAVAGPLGAVAVVAAVLLFMSAVAREQQHILGELVRRLVEGQVLDVAAAAELEAFENPSFHNRLRRAQIGSQRGPGNLVWGVSGLVSAASGGVAVLAALLTVEPLLVPLIALVAVPAWLAASRRGEAFWRFAWRMTPADRERDYLANLLSAKEPAKEVKAFGLGGYFRRRYERLFDERIAGLRAVARRQLLYSLAANLSIGVFTGATLVLLAWLTLTGPVALSETAVAAAGVAVIGARLAGAGYAAGALQEAALFMDDYLSFMDLLPQAAQARRRAAAPRGFRRITLEDVWFTYPSGHEPALRGVSMHIDAGEVVALVGENGSGKTTTAKLIAGLYSPDVGTILWDDTDITAVDPDERRRSIAVIFQDFVRYSLAARDNVGLGDHQRIDDLDAIRAAAQQADVDEFLQQLRDGYDTILGPEFEGGVDLSVGQWQRIALARAFFRSSPLVILDEPTAALDARAEHLLFQRIRALLAGRTVLLISHRFSSVRSADRIYVLDRGSIVEDGTHGRLMANQGLYAELFSLQAAAYSRDRGDGAGQGDGDGPGGDHGHATAASGPHPTLAQSGEGIARAQDDQ